MTRLPLLAGPILAAGLAASSFAEEAQVWSFDGASVLAHMVPDTDDADFRARCTPGSGTVAVMVTETVAGLAAGLTVPVILTTDAGHAARPEAGVERDEESGAFVPVVTLAAGDPILTWLARDRSLGLRIEGGPSYTVSLSGSAKPVGDFVAACAG